MRLLQPVFLFIIWVKMFDISDSELIMLIRENNEEASYILNQKYTIIIKKIVNHHYYDLKKLNVNIEELIMSCYELLNEAIEQYNPYAKASFSTYVNLIIKRKIKKTIIKALRDNKKVMEDYSINIEDMEKLSVSNTSDPLKEMCDKESEKLLNKVIIENLNNKELAIVSLLLEGMSIKEIAFTLMQSYKQIYNNIQNIKRKIAPELQKIMD